MAYSIDIINTICTDLGGTGGHKYEIDGLNEICTLIGATTGHKYNIDALNAICAAMGYSAGHKYNIDALNAIYVGGTYIYEDDAWQAIQIGSKLNYEYLFSGMPDGNLPAAFKGSTYSINEGKAFNNPLLGIEKLNDAGFENWTNATTPTNWETYLSGASTINRESVEKRSGNYSAKLTVDASNSTVYLIKSTILTVGKYYRASVWAKADSGNPTFKLTGGKSKTVTLTTEWVEYVFTFFAASAYFALQPVDAAGRSIYFDDSSIKEITASTVFSLIDSKKSNVSVVSKIYNASNNHGGIACCCNDLINPTSGIFAYTDGINVFLFKIVNGVYTSLNNGSVVSYVDGYEIAIVKKGTTVSVLYGGRQMGVAFEVTNVEIINNTFHGLLSTTSLISFSRFAVYNNPVGSVMLTFDDCWASQYTEAYSYMKGKVKSGTVYVISDRVGTENHCSLSQLQEMHADGWVMANHTKSHLNLITQSQDIIESELMACKNALEGWGFTNASSHVAYPGGNVNATVRAAMAATGMLTGRTTEIANGNVLATKEYDLIYDIPSIMVINNVSTLDGIKTAINKAVSGGLIAIFYIHAITAVPANANEMSIDIFRGMIDWLVLNNIQNISITDFYNKIKA